jgi:hypothetical protein
MLDIERLSRIWDVPIRTFFNAGDNEGQISTAAPLLIPRSSGVRLRASSRHVFHAGAASRRGPALRSQSCLEQRHGFATFSDAQYLVRKSVAAREITVGCKTLDEFCRQHPI